MTSFRKLNKLLNKTWNYAKTYPKVILSFLYFLFNHKVNCCLFVIIKVNIILHLTGKPLFFWSSTSFCLSKLTENELKPLRIISFANQYKIMISPYGFRIRIAQWWLWLVHIASYLYDKHSMWYISTKWLLLSRCLAMANYMF